MTTKTIDICQNNHIVDEVGGRDPRGRCRACNREASKRYEARRAAGIPIDKTRSHARKDLGYTELLTKGD